MPSRARLTDLTLADLRRIDAARELMEGAYDAIKASNMHGKGGALTCLEQADRALSDVAVKGARQALERIARGGYRRLHLDEGFVSRLEALAGEA